ncbi:ricin-type beta-trefoil lectin domain protein [Actinoplanes sp. NPDC049265]|uniref:RICIN domain-containing protein n=1 Tax=Actinoplanes sp. NPDC049265 TaxID=3363902 RepID=UPI00371480EF
MTVVLAATLATPAAASVSGFSATAGQVTNGSTVADKTDRASAATTETYKNLATRLCLDSNKSKHAYTNPCSSRNKYQNWTVIRHGSTRLFRNVATRLCLDSNKSKHAYTNPCSSRNKYQNWTVIRHGSTRLFRNVATRLCLDSNKSKHVYTNPCTRNNKFQNWH